MMPEPRSAQSLSLNTGETHTPAYMILEVEFLDKDAAKHYMKYTEASISKYSGRYLTRGAELKVLEGEPTEWKLVIVEFPSPEQAQAWHASSEYADALRFRAKALNRRLVSVSGISPSPIGNISE